MQIKASFISDTIPPGILSFSVPGLNSIFLELSEEIDTSFLHKDQFLLIPGNFNPENIIAEGKTIICSFSEPFIQKTNYKLILTNIIDKEGNKLISDSIDFFYYHAEKNDLVITEIMADPSPVVYLRESEYIELFNRSELPVNLDSFILQTGKKQWIFPAYVINPGEYLVVTNGSETGNNTLPLFTSSSVITNDGQQILLKNKYDEIITASEFYSEWYGNDFKSEGGWSLERIDENNLCGGKENWKASEYYLGGTPGWKNSVQAINADFTDPFTERIEFVNENKVRFIMNENIDPSTIPSPEFFNVSSGLLQADSVIFPDFFCSYIEIVFDNKFQKGVIYQLNIPGGICDCAGNQLEVSEAIRFGLPSSAVLTDIIITEVLFSNLPACPEYIEIYNISEHLLDLSDIRISVSQPGSEGTTLIPINKSVLFFPEEYLVLCKDREALLSCHNISDPDAIIEVEDLPSLRDDGACIKLINRSLEPVDIFCYDPSDEFPMLSDFHGVSIERLSLDRNTGEQSLWHSASSISGFGTPGKENSQTLTGITALKTIEFASEIFSPNNDGKDDILEIHYSFDKEGFIGTMAVFDPAGRIVCFLGENKILGTSGMFLWDGRNDNGIICSTGLYLIYAEIWNLKGEKEKFKKAVVLVRE
jgi:hypothetical protein